VVADAIPYELVYGQVPQVGISFLPLAPVILDSLHTEAQYCQALFSVNADGVEGSLEVEDNGHAGKKRRKRRQEKTQRQARKDSNAGRLDKTQTQAGLTRLKRSQEKTQTQARKDSNAGKKRHKGRQGKT
jgi:hypothetical protein